MLVDQERLFLSSAGQEHDPELIYDGSMQLVAIGLAPDSEALNLPPQVNDYRSRLLSTASWLRGFGDHPTDYEFASMQALMQAFIGEYRRLAHANDVQPDLVSRSRSFMEAGLSNNFGVADICAALGVSESTLRRAFLAETGEPPLAHLRQIRAETALNLLRENRFDLDEIAARIGVQHSLRFHV